MFSVLTLGTVALRGSDDAPIDLTGRRSREVIAAIATGGGAPVARRSIWSWMWPDLPDDQARKALNTEVWRLRKSVCAAGGDPDALIASTPHDLRLCTEAGTRCDLAGFRGRLDAAQGLDEMIGLARRYRGDFAEGLSADWMETIRAELRSAFVGLLHRIVAEALAANRLAEATFHAERLTVEEPYDEVAIRALMRAALAAGDRGLAVSRFRAFAQRLRADLDVAPTERTAALLRDGGEAVSPGYRIEPARAEDLALADARRKLLAISDLVATIRRDLSAIARDLGAIGD